MALAAGSSVKGVTESVTIGCQWHLLRVHRSKVTEPVTVDGQRHLLRVHQPKVTESVTIGCQ